MRKYGNYLAAKSKIIVEFQNGSDPHCESIKMEDTE